MAQQTKTRPPGSVTDLLYFVTKIQPLSKERDAVAKRQEEIEEKLFPLQRSAKELAQSAFDDLAQQAANEWKSVHGDEDLTMQWVDERFDSINSAVIEFANYGNYSSRDTHYDLMRFFQSVKNLLEASEPTEAV